MKIKFILGAMLVVGAVSYSAEAMDAVAQEVINEVRNIEAEYQALMQKEAEVAGYYQIMDEDIKTTEAIEEATPVVEPVQQ